MGKRSNRNPESNTSRTAGFLQSALGVCEQNTDNPDAAERLREQGEDRGFDRVRLPHKPAVVARPQSVIVQTGANLADADSMDAADLCDSKIFQELAKRWLGASDADFRTLIDDFEAYREETKEATRANDHDQLAFLAHALVDSLTAPLPHKDCAVDIK